MDTVNFALSEKVEAFDQSWHTVEETGRHGRRLSSEIYHLIRGALPSSLFLSVIPECRPRTPKGLNCNLRLLRASRMQEE